VEPAIDLPMDEQWQAGSSYFWEGKQLSYALGASVMYAGDAEVDQTAQGVRFKGEFETNLVYSLGTRYVTPSDSSSC
jgi:hypothetical protein